jgi:hypothetical protein
VYAPFGGADVRPDWRSIKVEDVFSRKPMFT